MSVFLQPSPLVLKAAYSKLLTLPRAFFPRDNGPWLVLNIGEARSDGELNAPEAALNQ